MKSDQGVSDLYQKVPSDQTSESEIRRNLPSFHNKEFTIFLNTMFVAAVSFIAMSRTRVHWAFVQISKKLNFLTRRNFSPLNRKILN